jgi:hypothetical protein
MPRYVSSKLIQKNSSRWVHLDKLVMLMAAFTYSIVDLIISFKGVSLNELSEDERSSYGVALALLSSFFIYATFSEFTNSHKRYKHSVNKYHRLNLKLGVYQAELKRDKSKMHWEYLPFNLKADITGGKVLNQDLIAKVFPSEGEIDFEMYLFLAWEQFVAKKQNLNKVFHLTRVSNRCCKVPILSSNYALLSMFLVDLVLSIWGLDPFENTKVHYPIIFLSVFLVLMAGGFKLVNWSQNQMLANDKPEFIKKKFYKLRSLLEQYRLSHPDIRVEFVKVFSTGVLDRSNDLSDIAHANPLSEPLNTAAV